MTDSRSDSEDAWPALPYAEWQPTLETLHMWTQIVGKIKLALTPFLNDWWNVTFAVTARGLTTLTIPFDRRLFQMDFDFIDHRLWVHVNDGQSRSVALAPRSVADFYAEILSALASLDISVRINPNPVEVDSGIAFDQDRVHAEYDQAYVDRFRRLLQSVSRVLERYRTPFLGKNSPVQFWWGSFDLSTTRYSGRRGPSRQRPARWMAVSAELEQALAGFWPGNARMPEPAFVAYTSPEPPGCRSATLEPDTAYFHPELAEFVLPYARVRQAPDPEKLILDFYRSAYEIGATLAGWDRDSLERPDPTSSVAHHR
jgi:hypothetical protein